MFGFIEKLRTKSETYRRGVALGTSFVATLVIFFVWISVVFPNAIPGGAVLAEKGNTEEVRSAGFLASSTAFPSEPASESSSRAKIENGTISSFNRNAASSFEAVKNQLRALGKFFGETTYEAEDGEVEVVPSRSTWPSGVNTSTTNRGDSVIY